MKDLPTAARHRLLPHFWVGLALLAVGQILILARGPDGYYLRPLSDYWFAFVWFGYVLLLDAYLFVRDGRSLAVSRTRTFLALFPLSAAMWWGFEWINGIVQNWHYLRPYDIPDWWAALWSGIFFSTVAPAIWETADLVAGWRAVRRRVGHRSFVLSRRALASAELLGLLMFILPALWPQYFFPLIWGFAALILDPINYRLGNPSILGYISRGDWRVPASFYVAGQVCGVLWEFWNYWAFPKWYYTIPYVGFLKIFEMPLLGYIGYGPFALEVFTVVSFASGIAHRLGDWVARHGERREPYRGAQREAQ